MSQGDKRENIDSGLSVANLDAEFKIGNPRMYIRRMRTTFLRLARESKNLTNDQVCEQLGLDRDNLDRLESGNVTEKDMMALNALADLYEVDYFKLLQLFKLAETNPEKEAGIAAYHSSELDDKTKDEIVSLVKNLKKQFNN